MDFREIAGNNVIVIDGAMGTMLQDAGMMPGECPEAYNVVEPEMIAEIHRQYMGAGVHALTSNTFGGSRPKLAEHGLEDQLVAINRTGVEIARALHPTYVLADVGPTGLVMEPMGEATFDELFAIYVEQIEALALGGPDAIMIATQIDIAEARCALLAAKSVCDIPVIVSCTFGLDGRMNISGTDPATAAVILEACGADVVGMNCGLGPEQMYPLVQQMAEATSLPIVVQPNAGLPQVAADGSTFYPGTPDEMAEWAVRFHQAGAALLGSCCGSTPAFTAAIYASLANEPVVAHGPQVEEDTAGAVGSGSGTIVASARETLRLGGGAPIRIIGERINPTGKPVLADSLREGSLSHVRALAAEQDAAGADLLDVNVGAAGVDAVKMLPAAVTALSGSTSTPLVIDSINVESMEAALKAYPGRALLNSVSGEEKSLDQVLPLAKRYGAAVVALALDDDGIPATVEGRLAVVEKIRARAHEVGLTDSDLVVDSLVMTAAAQPEAPEATLNTVERVHAMGLTTILGVSNVSHGLPQRSLLNSAFIGAAAVAGLDIAIANPNDETVVEAVRVGSANRDTKTLPEMMNAWDAAYESALAAANRGDEDETAGETAGETNPAEALATTVSRGDSDGAPKLVDALIAQGMEPSAVIGEVLTPAIQELGDGFGRGEVFLPQMMVAAEAMKVAVDRAKSHMPEGEGQPLGRVVFATVSGDIHSIGKNICVSMLESQGFEVNDLGVDVVPDLVVKAANNVDVVCLSALMTTTLPAMEETVRLVQAAHPDTPVFVGGAVVTGPWAEALGARYTKDAPELVNHVRSVIEEKKGA